MIELKSALRRRTTAVLQAPAGSGKTTGVPPALLQEPWLAGRRILMLEPRRLAARAAARRMADLLAEPVGRTVGYRVRLETCVGPSTRIEVLTEGILTRMLQEDPSLSGTGLVIFDEFHERHVESDLGLALCLDLQPALNPELRLLVMSATLDPGPVAEVLGGAPVIACAGRQFEVETRWIAGRTGLPVERTVAEAVLQATHREPGSILAFLPGALEIRRTLARLKSAGLTPGWLLAPLFGNLSKEEQDQAIVPAPPGRRKIVLATNIAESSLTIEGIRIVVDGGLTRVPRFDVRSGMTRLATLPVSQASADQRRGRAGRTAPGVCYRLWSEAAHALLPERNSPEILQADLAPLALELALWGVQDPLRLRWLDPPPAAALQQARGLLRDLGALEPGGGVSIHGRRLAELPLHPRLAHMVLAACERGWGAAACDFAAVLSERDFLKFAPGEEDADLRLRLEAMAAVRRGGRGEAGRAKLDRPACRRCIRLADVLRRRLAAAERPLPAGAAGRLLAWAYPDRIGRRRPGTPGRFVLTSGRGAYFASQEPLGAEEFIVAANLDGERREARIYLAAGYDQASLREDFTRALETGESVVWDERRRAVSALRVQRLGALILQTEAIAAPDPQNVAAALIEGIRRAGIGCLPWTRRLRDWQQRVLFLRRVMDDAEPWPDISDRALIDSAEKWLAPFLSGITRLDGLKDLDLMAALGSLLSPRQRSRLAELAPTHFEVPSGSRIRLDYSGEVPVLAVRVQQMFGCAETPRVAGGRRPVQLHLLSPAGRPVQVTQDLAGFWSGSYAAVRKEMRGRYPKHSWPVDPLHAAASRGGAEKRKRQT